MHSAAILAGGRATRFGGRDKSALVVDGRTILDRQLAMLADVADEVQVVREDLVPDRGPLGGVHTALTRARHDLLFVLACDMPHVTAPFASYLLSIADAWDLVVPRTERGYHPLCAVYRRSCLPAIARRLAERHLKMTALFSDVRVREVSGEDVDRFGDRDWLLANVNTPAELAGLEALQGHKL
ncbi:MAG TPA: molybdenum cofactor guanylyltransferase [Vicinamibacterales bacterium]|nr:molybdenum cofactor guanylyltransferase [Vicinamibacterales bacterium]